MRNCTHKRSDGERPVDRILDGGLSPEELAEAEAHIESCADCAETKQILEATRSVWKEREDPAIPAALRDRVEGRLWAAIAADEKTPHGSIDVTKEAHPTWRGYLLTAVAVAAVLLVALYFTIRLYEKTDTVPTMAHFPDQPDKTPADQAGPNSELRATVMDISGGLASYERKGEAVKPVVERQVLGLGEVITLGEGASVRFAIGEFAVVALGDGAIAELVSKEGSQGIDLKRGSAALKVDSDQLDRLFKVVTPAGDVEVNGTVFYVNVSASAELTVAVVESKVTIRDSANPRNVIPVHSGQEIDVDWSAPKVSPIDRDLETEIQVKLGLSTQSAEHAEAPEKMTDTGGAKKQASRKDRAGADELFAKATLARKSGDVQEAARMYQSIVKSEATRELRAEAAFNLGQLYFTSSKFEAAEKVLSANRALLERSSFRAMYLFYLAKTRCQLGKHNDAARVIDRFFNQLPNHSLADSMRKLKEHCRE